MIPPAELEAIRERAEKATKGPWAAFTGGEVATCVEYDSGNHPKLLAKVRSHAANADFIAHAREDIPRLLADATECREVIAELVRALEKVSAQHDHSSVCERAKEWATETTPCDCCMRDVDAALSCAQKATESPLERYERMAEAFYRATRMMAPGKDVPSGMGFTHSDEERRAAWEKWLAEVKP